MLQKALIGLTAWMRPDVTNFHEQMNIFVTSVTALVLYDAAADMFIPAAIGKDTESCNANKIRNNHSVQVICNIRFPLAESNVILKSVATLCFAYLC